MLMLEVSNPLKSLGGDPAAQLGGSLLELQQCRIPNFAQ
jgi:hypothetical protein